MKKKLIKQQPIDTQLKLVGITYCWEGAFPYIKETYTLGSKEVVVGQYISSEKPEFEQFLYKTMRSGIPSFLKANFTKIKKQIRAEIKHRQKLNEKLTKEQKHAISIFFSDTQFFTYTEDSEFFDLEVEKAIVSFVRATLETKFYETFVSQGLKNRATILAEHGRF